MQPLQTPTTSDALKSVRTDTEKGIIQGETVDRDLAQGVERWRMLRSKAFPDRVIFLDENAILFEQNNKRVTRRLTKATVVGTTKV